ncbi:MarR family transcriptional regulator [Candidatus Bathyarchaeota archaeon]|nr:MarR family transcriptional regulator [Candidatus Bathyarchaeota archaeon]
MKSRLLLALLAVLLLLSTVNKANCQDYIQYQVQMNNDNSAAWVITQVSDINATIDTWEGFQQKIFNLADAATKATNREMAIEPESIQMETAISWETQSKTTEYRFKWLNFSTTENDKIVFGDVFQVPEFFSQLYGDGPLQITYPFNSTIISVAPTPDNQDDDLQKLEWYRTQDFINGKPSIIFGLKSQNGVSWPQSTLIAAVSATALAASLIGFYLFRRNRQKTKDAPTAATFAGATLTESDEDKILKTIQSSGGSLNQTAIAEQCRFSKAKTSQLLTALEQKGVIKRFKKGRDKIVMLTEKHNKGENK